MDSIENDDKEKRGIGERNTGRDGSKQEKRGKDHASSRKSKKHKRNDTKDDYNSSDEREYEPDSDELNRQTWESNKDEEFEDDDNNDDDGDYY